MADPHPTLSPDHDLWQFQMAMVEASGDPSEALDHQMLTGGTRLSPDRKSLETLTFMLWHETNPEYVRMMHSEPEELIPHLLFDEQERITRQPLELTMAGWVNEAVPLERRFELQAAFQAEHPDAASDFGNSDTMSALICAGWLISDLPEETKKACAEAVLQKLPTDGEHGDVQEATRRAAAESAEEYRALLESTDR
ncbi:MAG: hypothetical protein M3N59_00525 [bacterium]|nr:hypothetical protein [bacterium]